MAKITNSTLLIRLSDQKYPYSLYQIRNETGYMMGPEPDEEFINSIGFAVVDLVDRPEGDVVTEGVPEATEDPNRFKQVWVVRDFNVDELAANLEQAKTRRLQILDTNVANTLAQGFEHLFSDSEVLHVQLRDGDRANLAGLRITADKLVANGETDPIMEIMTYEDTGKNITPSEMVELTDEAFVNYTGIMKSKWIYRVQISNAKTIEEIPIIPAIIPVYQP